MPDLHYLTYFQRNHNVKVVHILAGTYLGMEDNESKCFDCPPGSTTQGSERGISQEDCTGKTYQYFYLFLHCTLLQYQSLTKISFDFLYYMPFEFGTVESIMTYLSRHFTHTITSPLHSESIQRVSMRVSVWHAFTLFTTYTINQ